MANDPKFFIGILFLIFLSMFLIRDTAKITLDNPFNHPLHKITLHNKMLGTSAGESFSLLLPVNQSSVTIYTKDAKGNTITQAHLFLNLESDITCTPSKNDFNVRKGNFADFELYPVSEMKLLTIKTQVPDAKSDPTKIIFNTTAHDYFNYTMLPKSGFVGKGLYDIRMEFNQGIGAAGEITGNLCGQIDLDTSADNAVQAIAAEKEKQKEIIKQTPIDSVIK